MKSFSLNVLSLQNIPTGNPSELKRLFTHEMMHVLGFSAKLFPRQAFFLSNSCHATVSYTYVYFVVC